jgi:hypothetical protein
MEAEPVNGIEICARAHPGIRIWRVMVDGRQVGLWTKRRWAKRDLREKLREKRRAASETGGMVFAPVASESMMRDREGEAPVDYPG